MTRGQTHAYQKGRPGWGYRDGKLYRFKRQHVVVLNAWPDPRAWLKRASHDWRPDRKFANQAWTEAALAWELASLPAPPPEPPKPKRLETELFPDLFPDPTVYESAEDVMGDERTREQARFEASQARIGRVVRPFMEAIPESIRQEMLTFQSRGWNMLNFLARCPGGLDLVRSNATLAYALAHNWVFHRPAVCRPMRTARSLVNRKQKRILGWLGFPATEQARRILAKVARKGLTVESLLGLRKVLNTDPERAKILSHLPGINADALRLVCCPALYARVTAGLITEAAAVPDENDPDGWHASRLLVDTRRMARELDGQDLAYRFGSLRRLEQIHDRYAGRYGQWVASYQTELPESFPAPPYPGTPDIVPIRTLSDLVEEGASQEHCCASYAHGVAAGRCYLYRVLAPVRATLSIIMDATGQWQPEQLKGKGNRAVPERAAKGIWRDLFMSNPEDWAPAKPDSVESGEQPAFLDRAARLLGARLVAPVQPRVLADVGV